MLPLCFIERMYWLSSMRPSAPFFLDLETMMNTPEAPDEESSFALNVNALPLEIFLPLDGPLSVGAIAA